MTEIEVTRKKYKALIRVHVPTDGEVGSADACVTTAEGDFRFAGQFSFPPGCKGTEDELADWIRKGLKWVAWL
jgi:hypothetical protein